MRIAALSASYVTTGLGQEAEQDAVSDANRIGRASLGPAATDRIAALSASYLTTGLGQEAE